MILYNVHTIWLVTRNDLKSIVFPETAFGICSALSGPMITSNNSPDVDSILNRIPLVLLWTWINVLIFDLANQRLPNSIVEDSINKPWRPIPSGRLSPCEARRLLLAVVPVAILVTFYTGGMEETIFMNTLEYMYNDLGGADENFVVRNLINAAGFICYSAGATRVASGHGQHSLNQKAYHWLAIIGAIVFSTLQMQDMADQEGDRARDRRTLPLVLGDWTARWTISMPVILWSFICPAFWEVHLYCWILPVFLGSVVAYRALVFRDAVSDKKTWIIWNLWITSLYLLPLIKFHEPGH
ncbi:UbiA prenyltransferase family-domain-containing protein [Usnea florida]